MIMIMTVELDSAIFSPLYIVGHIVGTIVVKIVQILSGVVLPDILVDTIGLLTIVTMLLILVEVAKKMAWGIVTICWGLILYRIGMLMMEK